MKKIIVTVGAAILLSGCCSAWTDRATFEHPETKEVVECGGCMSGELALGGMIGHSIAQNKARQCFKETLDQGYETVSYTKSHGAMQSSTTLTGITARESVRGAIR